MFRDPFRLYLSLAGGLSIAVEDAGGRCNAPGPRALGNLGDKLDQSQEMPTPRLYHSKRNGTREKNHGRSATRRASRLRHQIQDSVQEDHIDTRSGKFAQSREPLDARVKHSTHRCWKFAQGGGGGGAGFGEWDGGHIPIPRDATSVATMMGLFPVLNWSKTQSRSFCCLSP